MAYDVTAAELLDELNKMQRRALAAEEEVERLRAARPQPTLDREAVRIAVRRNLPNDALGATLESLIVNDVMKLVGSQPPPTRAEITEQMVVAAGNALLDAGFVDPDDGTIPQWLDDGNPAPVWTHPSEAVKVTLAAVSPYVGAVRPLPTREQIAEALREHNIECTGPGEVTCRGCRDKSWMSWSEYRAHVADAVVALFTGGEE